MSGPDGGARVCLQALTLAGAVQEVAQRLDGAGIADARREASVLFAYLAGIERQDVLMAPERALLPDERERLEAALARRLAREPITRIAGTAEFYGRNFRVTPDVLDPRADSETLIRQALDNRARWAERAAPRILDIGTGSGCLLATLLCEVPSASGVGIDVSEAACTVARHNLDELGLSDRARVLVHDADKVPDIGTFNLIVSNPPYVGEHERSSLDPEVRDHDPELALFAGDDGLAKYEAWLAWIPAALAPGGGLILEIGWRQAAAVTGLVENAFAASQSVSITVAKDLNGRDRSVAAWTRS
jgi:release factor glutamine methyltransferase